MTTRFLLGCDPEVFLSMGDKFISAHGLLPGTKSNPYEVDGGAVQVDGLAFEFNIKPAETPEQFTDNIEKVLSQMNEMVRNIDKDIRINFTPFASFDKKEFDTLPLESKILGCDPDFRATDGEVNPAPEIQNVPVRTAAGHIHIGWTEGQDAMGSSHFEDARFVANHLHNSGIFSPSTKEEHERLKYYGMNGSFRPKTYGVEFRAPSNIWVSSREGRIRAFGKVMTELQRITN